MTKKDARNSLRASIETTSSSILGSGGRLNKRSGEIMNEEDLFVQGSTSSSPSNKRKCIKKELNDNEQSSIENYKKRLDEHKDSLHESMTKFLNSLYDELENSRVNLEESCVRSLQRAHSSYKRCKA
ncbi:hypothetical protein OJ253_3638 [Cryptosporidium canis]|uniref:Uncharacterized protein n=1 Tax=Cryptosporidium canis TaxID=195482 RepID=A0A9D5DDX4_9CRYT|nr:hypothetical protein OJ253_3638 [Cryptosporidium canis]